MMYASEARCVIDHDCYFCNPARVDLIIIDVPALFINRPAIDVATTIRECCDHINIDFTIDPSTFQEMLCYTPFSKQIVYSVSIHANLCWIHMFCSMFVLIIGIYWAFRELASSSRYTVSSQVRGMTWLTPYWLCLCVILYRHCRWIVVFLQILKYKAPRNYRCRSC